MANETIEDLTPKGAPMGATDIFESEVPDGKGGYLTRSQTGQNVVDGVVARIGPLQFIGGWNASTNTPTLASGVGTNGYVYIVTVAGDTTLDGNTDWQIKDWAVFNGVLNVWEKIDNTEIPIDITGSLFVASYGSSSNSGGLDSPLDKVSTAMALATAGQQIVMLTDITDDDVYPKPNVALLAWGEAALTCNKFNLDDDNPYGWGTTDQTLIVGPNVTLNVTDKITIDNRPYDTDFQYYLDFKGIKLICPAGLIVYGLMNGAIARSFGNFDNVNCCESIQSAPTCNIEIDTGFILTASPGTRLGLVDVYCRLTNGATIFTAIGSPIFGNFLTAKGLRLHSPEDDFTGATVNVNLIASPQRFSPLLQTAATGNNIQLSMDSGSYLLPIIGGGGVAGEDYTIRSFDNSDAVGYGQTGNTLNFTPKNIVPRPDPLQNKITGTMLAAGADDAALKTETNVYFSNYGTDDDINARAQTNPTKTASFLLSQIADAFVTKVYNMYRQGDVSDAATQVEVKPWINVLSTDNGEWQLGANPLILNSAAWSMAANNYILINNHKLIGDDTVINFDLSALPSNTYKIELSNLKFYGKNILITGKVGTTVEIFNIDGSVSPSSAGVASLVITNCHARIRDAISGSVTIQNTSNDSFSVQVDDTRAYSTMLVAASGAGTLTFRMTNSPQNSLILSGANVTSFLDVESASNVTLANSAPAPTLITKANGLSANLIPGNYITPGVSVTDHLTGINNQLAMFGGILTDPTVNLPNVAGLSALPPAMIYVITPTVETVNLPTAVTVGQILTIIAHDSGYNAEIHYDGQIVEGFLTIGFNNVNLAEGANITSTGGISAFISQVDISISGQRITFLGVDAGLTGKWFLLENCGWSI